MKSIYASKLYKASNRKERIQAALQSPSNLSLVQQLAADLDEEYKTPRNLGVDEPEEAVSEDDDLFVDDEVDIENDLMTVDDFATSEKSKSKPKDSKSAKGGPSPSHFSPKSSPNENPDFNNSSAEDVLSKPDDGQSAPSEGASKETEASTKIQSCTQIDLSALKDSLNNRDDTHGVLRITEKENEIWIYYRDEVNLNNIMTEVIEYLLNSGLVSLEFNRLARSDNAIVFQKIESTQIDPKSVTETAKN